MSEFDEPAHSASLSAMSSGRTGAAVATGTKPSRVRQILAFAAVYLIWGSTYLAIRVGVESIPPFLMAGCRFVLAGGVLFAFLRGSGVAAPTGVEWRHAAVAGLLMITIGNGLVTWAEQRVPSSLAALVVAAVPLYTALLDWWRPGGHRPDRLVLAGIAIGFAGMVLLVVPDPSAINAHSTAGVIAVLISALGWSVGSLYARYAIRHRHSIMVSAQHMLAGGVALLTVGLLRGEGARLSLAAISGRSALAFVYLTVFGSLVAFSAFGWLVVVSSPARLSTTAYVNPVVAVILGWCLLGETLTPRALGGAALIIAAVAVMTLGQRSFSLVRARWRRR